MLVKLPLPGSRRRFRLSFSVALFGLVPLLSASDLALFSRSWLKVWADPAPSSSWLEARAELMAEADAALNHPIYSVVGNEILQASGDPHDYFSMGPYWWPNPETDNGLPYVRRDGRVNPQRDRVSDRENLHGVCDAIRALGLAYAATEDERYAEKAATFLRAFFFDPETRMNPNLRYAQAVPGVADGRGVGIIDARVFTRLVDGVTLLQPSEAWSDEDQARLVAWFTDYTHFLREDPIGLDERQRPNNHGTAYDLQLTACLVFIGDIAAAREHLETVSRARLPVQFEEGGRQPLELARTKAWNYVWENLENWFRLAVLGEKIGVDLWTADDAALRRGFAEALRWWRRDDLKSAWEWKQILPFGAAHTDYVRAAGAIVYSDLVSSHEQETWIAALPVIDLMQLPERR